MIKSKNEQMMFDKYNDLKAKNESLKMQLSQLLIAENKIRNEQENLNEYLADINKKISTYSDKIDSILKDDSEDNILSNENLKKKCLEKFNLFFINQDGIQEQSIFEFHIEYSNTVFKRTLEKESMTFAELKKEMRYQIGRSENEFFFCDTNSSIFLDDFIIKDVLFPFSKVILKNSIPVIKIIENHPENEIFIDKANIEDENRILEDEKKTQDPSKNQLLQMIKRIISGSVYSFFFFIFLAFWAFSVLELRDVRNYFLMNHTFVYKKMLTIKYSNDYILDDIKKYYADVFGFPPQNSSFLYFVKKLNLFNQKNKNTYTMRFIQKRRLYKKCENSRISNVSLKDKHCGYFEENVSNFTRGNSTYKYNIAKNQDRIEGTFRDYDQSGFYQVISVDNPEDFYKSMDKLINERWVDQDTLSLVVNYNIYSMNNDLFLFFRIVWENQGFYFKRYPSFGLLDLTPKSELYSVISVSFSLILIGYKIYELKKDQSEITNKKTEDSNIKNNDSLKERILKCRLLRFFGDNFRAPKLIELLTFGNIIFSYVCLLKKISFNNKVKGIKFNSEQYVDLLEYSLDYDYILNLFILNILIFIISLIDIISKMSKEFNYITKSIYEFIGEVFSSKIFIIGMFMFFSIFTGLYIIKDFPQSYYRDNLFILNKFFTMLFRGTIDNIDYDEKLDRYKLKSNYYPEKIQFYDDFYNCNYSLEAHSGKFFYVMFSILFFFGSYFIIKIPLSAHFLIKYKKSNDNYEKEKESNTIKKQQRGDEFFF